MAAITTPEPRPRSAILEPPPVTAGERYTRELHLPNVLPFGRVVTLLMLVLFAVFFGIVGYQVTVNQHVIVFDALDRLTRAYQVWYSHPAKLAAIGFQFPPFTTLVLLPLALIKPLATGLTALPLSTAVFGGITIVFLERTLSRCDLVPALRLVLVLLFAINPLFVFYAGNGMSEMVYLAALSFTMYCLVSWIVLHGVRWLFGAGFGFSVLVLTRYAFIVWVLALAILIGVALSFRRNYEAEAEGSVIAFAVPAAYALAVWTLLNTLIVGDPFGWISTSTTAQAVNSSGAATITNFDFGDVMSKLGALAIGVFPLALVSVPALIGIFVARRDQLALWLAGVTITGVAIIAIHAATANNLGLLALRDAMPVMLMALIGAGWVFRELVGLRLAIFAVIAAVLAVGIFTAWRAMDRYPFQSLEQAFRRAIQTGKDQQGMASRGGYRVGVLNEAQLAVYVRDHITAKKSVLTDNAQTFGVILLEGNPQLFFDRISQGDTRWKRVLKDPFGRVPYILLVSQKGSSDLVARQWSGLIDHDSIRGFTVVFRTNRYVLARVASRSRSSTGIQNPAAPIRTGRGGQTTGTGR